MYGSAHTAVAKRRTINLRGIFFRERNTMKSNELPKSAWKFITDPSADRVRWAWMRTDGDGIVREEAEHFHSLGAAMADARKNGFNEDHDKFMIA